MPQAVPMLAYYAAGQSAAGALVSLVVSAALADYQKTAAADKAKAQAARDRTVNIRSGVAPRKLVLGTARLGGAVMYGEFVGADLEYLDMIYALHHGDAGALTDVLGVYLDDEFVPAADLVDGVPTTGKYSGANALELALTYTQTVTVPTSVFTLPYVPSGDVYAVLNQGGTGETASQLPLTVASVVGTVVTLTTAVEGEVWLTYNTNQTPTVPLRLQWMLGTSTQASTTWTGVTTPKWTTDHRLRGVGYLRTLMRTEDRVFATGMPNPSLVCRGVAGVWDPRTSTTVSGTTNPALLAAWYRMLPKVDGGFGVPSDWIDWPSVATAANICDELLSVKKLDGTGYENVKRYECNTVLNLELPAADNLRVILGAMAGDFPFTGGKYRCYAGAFRAAAVTLTDDDVCGESSITFGPSIGNAVPPNVVTGRIYNAAKHWVEDAVPAVTNSTYVTADGREEVFEMDLPACTDPRQANYLMGVRLEQMRPGIAGSLTIKGKGANLALLDTVQLDLQGYEALDGKTFEVRRRVNHFNGRYTVDLAEVKASTFALDADRFTPPSTSTPGDTSELWNVTPPVITSVVNATLAQSDGSRVDRALVTWAAHPQALVNPRGTIEVRWRAPGREWVTAPPVPGDQVSTYIGPLGVGEVLFIEARARNSLGFVSAWAGTDPFTVTGSNDVPPDVVWSPYVIKPGQVQLTWTRWVDPSYLETELRVGASWAAGAFLWAGAASEYQHPRPANGTYTVWAVHRNRSGNISAAPQSLSVTVNDTIDPGAASAQLLKLNATGFAFIFDSEQATTTNSPTIDFNALLQNVSGTVTFTATAYNAANVSLGAVTLTSVTATTCALTAANFNALGALTTRYVKVSATLGSWSDTMTVYRGDNGSRTVQARLLNERHILPAAADGTVISYAGSGTTIQVFEGITELAYDGVGTANGTWMVTITQSGIAPGVLTDSGAFVTMGNAGGMAAGTDLGIITYTVAGKTTHGVSFSFPIEQRFVKSKAGTSGAAVTAYSDNGQVFIAASAGASFTPANIVLKRTLSTGLAGGTTSWSVVSGTFTGSLSMLSETDGRMASFVPSAMTTDAVTFRCSYTVGATVYTDDITITKSRDGFGAWLSNDSISLPASATGAISSYSGATGTFKVQNGAGDVSTAALAFSIVGHSGFGTTFPTNTGMSINSSGVYTVTGNVPDASTLARLDLLATYTDPLGGTRTFPRSFTITKSLQGPQGPQGIAGTGSQGITGTSARRAYALWNATTGAPSVTGTPAATTGSTSLPSTAGLTPAPATAFTATVQNPASGQAMCQSDGLYDPATNQVTWGTPYLSNLRVGSLSALVTISGEIKTAASGARIVLNESSSNTIRGYTSTGLLTFEADADNGRTRITGNSNIFGALFVTQQGSAAAVEGSGNTGPGVHGYSTSGPGVRASTLRVDNAPNTTNGGGALTNTNLPTGSAGGALHWMQMTFGTTPYWVACRPV